ncbi:exonuclease domain-containing protein [Halomonas piscis]|uniref:DNA-directed DNA polymerase n=1 Tax=Halomonas piscis TaxID=3031727 RepID=A0ABY9YVW0_9GAMM|nr:exonuclease domain-containing protein [Halomonas piscis]WNK19008.1 exonuclease domain-containing protein [Halomonas piscis]
MTRRERRGLPRRQRLVGLWLLLSGVSLAGGALFAAWLDSRLGAAGWERAALWLGCFSGGATILLAGLVLERMLFTPLRHLQAQLARLVASPDAHDERPPRGWLTGLGPDLARVREGWRADRARLAGAREEGAREAADTRQRLEALLQTLHTPLLLCDRHRRILLFNAAAERFFDGEPAPGLGKRLDTLLPAASLQSTLDRLPDDGTPRELLLPCGERWLKAALRRVGQSDGESLVTLEDATRAWRTEVGVRAELATGLGDLRRRAASLAGAADALKALGTADSPLRQRLAGAIDEDGPALSDSIARLGRLVDDMQRQGEQLSPIWSNDFWQALDERLDPSRRLITPVGMPSWFKGDAPALIALLDSLLSYLETRQPAGGADIGGPGGEYFEGEITLGNKQVYLDLIWHGKAIPDGDLARWQRLPLDTLPLAPTAAEVLRQHASDIWSLTDDGGKRARLRLPLPAVARAGPPARAVPPRPEFHDFGIAGLPSPDEPRAGLALASLDIVAFDTETTGLALRQGDTVVSLGACRIVNARVLADDTFAQRVNPGRPISPESTAIHGITDADVSDAPPLSEVLTDFRHYLGDAVLLAHNASFDMLAISHQGVEFAMPVLDTLLISRALDEALDGHDLDSLAARYAIAFPPGTRHTALGDARVTAALWLALLPRLEARGIDTLDTLLALQANAIDTEDATAP